MKLNLSSFSLYCRFAQLNSLSQIPFCPRNRYPEKGLIVGVLFVAFECPSQTHDSVLGVRILQHLDALGKLGDRIEFSNPLFALGLHKGPYQSTLTMAQFRQRLLSGATGLSASLTKGPTRSDVFLKGRS